LHEPDVHVSASTVQREAESITALLDRSHLHVV